MYVFVVMLLYNIPCAGTLIGSTSIARKEIRLIKLAAVLGGLI